MDLASKKEAEAILAEHLDELLGQTPWGICVMSAPSLRILTANALYTKQVSAPDPARLIGSIPSPESPDPLTRQLYPIWEAVLHRGEPCRARELAVTHPEMACYFEVTCVLLKHPDGSPSALVTMVSDVTRYKRLEEELRESEVRYRALAEHSGVGILQLEAEHYTLTYINPAMQALLEAESPQEVIGRTYRSLFTPESFPRIQQELEKRARGIASTYEAVILTKSGRRRTVVVNGAPILSPEGKLESVIATLVDITERKRIEDALRENEARYRALAENSGVGIMQLEAEHYTITYTNPAIRALLEAESPQELIGRTYQSLFTPESFVRVQQELEKRARGIASTYEAVILTKSGRRRTVVVNGAPILSPEGKLESVIGTLVDITERRRTMEALQESEARFRTLSATAPIGIFQMDARGYGIYVNERWQAITGRGFEEGLDLNWLAMIYHEDRPRIRADWEQTVKTGGESQFDMRIVTPGGLRWVNVHVAPIISPDGHPSGYVGTMEDITERKRTMEALQESEARFRTLSAAAPIGIFEMDAQGDCTYVNER
ncbi:MAG TPA: PAS domain-containing protein, partial [Armatimonadota bacterium]|nr:PAS domain-containing protein [Armatimonadota bacterium]